MKKLLKRSTLIILTLLLAIAILPTLAFAEPTTPVTTPDYIGVNAGSDVPESFTNDLWTQYDFKELKIDDLATITPRRVEEAISNPVGNDVEMPHFNYEIISGDAIKLLTDGETLADGTSTSENLHQGVKAVKKGNAIVKITYDELNHSAGKVFPACDPVNTQYIAYSVGGADTITIDVKYDRKIRSYDTIYFNEGANTLLPVTVSQTGGTTLTVKCNGIAVVGQDGVYNLPLENRNNIIEYTATDAAGNFRSIFKVIAARKFNIVVKNVSRPDKAITVDDKVNVSFVGVKMPVYKLATIYNPCMNGWGAQSTNVHYNVGETIYRGHCSQWDLATNNDFTIDKLTAGKMQFTAGRIWCEWWGKPLGFDKGTDGAGDPDLAAPVCKDEFSYLPDFEIKVDESVPMTDISFDKPYIPMEIGGKQTLKPTYAPDNTSQINIKWSSSNTNVATVDNNGVVTAVNAGQTRIVATCANNANISAYCIISVDKGDFQAVIDAIDALPEANDIKANEAWEINKKLPAIFDSYKNLLEDNVLVSNYKKLTDVQNKVNSLIKSQPFSIVGDNNTEYKIGKVLSNTLWKDNVREVIVTDDVESININANVPLSINIVREVTTDDSQSLSNRKQVVKNKFQNTNISLENILEDSVKSDYYNNGAWDGAWSGSWVKVQCGLVHNRLTIPHCNYYLSITTEDANKQKFIISINRISESALAEAIEIDNLINKIDSDIDQNSGDVIVSARTAYDSVFDEAKSAVQNYNKLLNAEAQYFDAMIFAYVRGDETFLTKARQYYNTLTPDAKNRTKYYENCIGFEAQPVVDLIANIGDVTLQSKDTIAATVDAYNALHVDAKNIISNKNVLDAAQAKYVDLLIGAIGEVSLTSNEAIAAARTAYTALPNNIKSLVTCYDALVAAETTLPVLQANDAKTTAEAKKVDDLITAIGAVTLESKDAIVKARNVYDNLTDDIKAKITKLDTLTAAETKYDEVKKADDEAKADAQAKEEQEKADAKAQMQANAANVDTLIDAIGTVTLDSDEKINTARTAYNNLSKEEKTYVSKLESLIKAEYDIKVLKNKGCNSSFAPTSIVMLLIACLACIVLLKKKA